jgi:Cu/Ag efflux pump CusA
MFVPMSVALMSGLIVSTLLTLIVIPMVYLWTHRDEAPMTEEANKVQRDLDALRRSIYGR